MIVDELVTVLNLEVGKKTSSNAAKFEKTLGGVASVAKQAGAALAAMSGAALLINSATAEFESMATAVGVTTDELKAWEGVMAGTQFTVDNVTDLIDEMNLKLGESSGLGEQMTPVREALQILGLEFANLSKLSPEEQFIAITQAAKDMANASEAAAAADILMGGEASRVIGVLRNQEGSIRDLLDAQRNYNFLTEDGIKGAKESTKEFNTLRRVATSLGQDIAGKAGGGIAIATAALTDFLVENNKLISSGIGQVIDGISLGFNMFGDILGSVGSAFSTIWGHVTNFLPVLKDLNLDLDATQAIGVAVAGALTALGAVVAVAAVTAAPAIAAFGLMAAKIAGLVLVVEDLYSWFSGGDSVFKGWYESAVGWVGKMVASIKGAFDRMGKSIRKVFEDMFKSIIDVTPDFILNAVGFDQTQGVGGPVQTQMPAQVMNQATNNNNSATVNNNFYGGGDSRAIADRVTGNMGMQDVVIGTTSSWNRYGG